MGGEWNLFFSVGCRMLEGKVLLPVGAGTLTLVSLCIFLCHSGAYHGVGLTCPWSKKPRPPTFLVGLFILNQLLLRLVSSRLFKFLFFGCVF